MRTENSAKNVATSFINNLLLNILRFVSRTIFIKVLGELYLGVNGILSNVLGILALADLGIGSAISFSLYKPLAENDKDKIKSLMNFYKKAYFVIGTIVLVAGLVLLPFLEFFIKDDNGIANLNIYYLVFLGNMVIGYYFSYKRTLIIADQHEYKITPIIMIFNVLITVFQIIVIFLFKNYLIYLLTQSVFILFENIIINNYINKQYPYILEKDAKKLSKEELKPIKTNVKALMYHKLGSYFVDSTDNIIISIYLGLSTVGIYSNYFLIITMLNSFISSGLRSTISSMGNANVSESVEKKYNIFKSINFVSFIVFSTCAICLFNLFNMFIGEIWIGEKYLLDSFTVLIISLVFYVNGLMHTNDAVKSSAGLYDKDKFVPIIQSIINIVASILLVKTCGLAGVFIGTLISAIFVMIIKPKIIYKYIFERKPWTYYIDFLIKLLILFISGGISYYIISLNLISNPIISFIVYGIMIVIINMLIIYICYHNKEEFKDIIKRVKYLLLKIRRKK